MRKGSSLTCLLVFLALALTVITVSVLTSSGNALSAEKVKVGAAVPRFPVYYLTFAVAKERGYWKQNGLSGEWAPFRSGRGLIDAMAADSIDMMWSIFEMVMPAVARGLPLVVVADLGAGLQWHFWVPSASSIKKPEDLKGKKIGVTRAGSGSHAFGRVVAKRLGLGPQTKFVATGGVRQLMAGLKTGVVEAMILPFLTVAKLKFDGRIRPVVSVSDHLPKPWLGLALFTKRDFIEKKPAVVKGTIRTILQATDFVMKNPRWSIEKMKSISGYSDAGAREVLASMRFSKDGKISRAGLENMAKFVIEYNLLSKGKLPPVNELYTTRFTGER